MEIRANELLLSYYITKHGTLVLKRYTREANIKKNHRTWSDTASTVAYFEHKNTSETSA